MGGERATVGWEGATASPPCNQNHATLFDDTKRRLGAAGKCTRVGLSMKRLLLAAVSVAGAGGAGGCCRHAPGHQGAGGAAAGRAGLQLDRLLHRRPRRWRVRRQRHVFQQRRHASSAAARSASTISSRRTGSRASRASIAGSAATTTTVWRSRRQASSRSTIKASARSPAGSAMPGVRCSPMRRAATPSSIAIST